MSQPAIEAPIVSTFDPKGVQQATKSLGGLEGAFKKFGLARKLTFAALTTAAIKYGKDAVRAAMADEKAQKNLLLTLRNLGKEYAMSSVNDFIKRQEQVSGVSKDILRPELQKLILSTNTVGEAQDLMALALNVSAGSTHNLSKVIGALIKAQNGDTESLRKLNLGLSEATLTSGSMVAVTEELTAKFSGQAAVATDNLAGKMNSLKLVIGDVQEQIGNKLVASINKLDAEQEVFKKLETNIRQAGDATVFFLDHLPKVVGLLEKISYYTDLARLGNLYPETPLTNALQPQSLRAIESGGTRTGFNNRFGEEQRFRLRITNAKIELELAKKRKTVAEATAKTEKQSAYTKKLNQMFDNDLVSINAALQNKITDEVRGRLIALKAQKTEDTNDDKSAIMEIISLQKKRADDAVKSWEIESAAAKKSYEEQYAAYLALVEKIKNNPLKQYVEYISSSGQRITTPKDFGMPGTPISETAPPPPAPVRPISSQPPTYQPPPAISDTLGFAGGGTVAGIPVAGVAQTVNVDLAVNGFVGNEQALAEEIARKLQLAQKLGYSTSIVGVP